MKEEKRFKGRTCRANTQV